MFDRDPFASWAHVLGVALLFGLLFGLIAVLGEVVVSGGSGVTPLAASVAAAAFTGVIVTALVLRRTAPPSDP